MDSLINTGLLYIVTKDRLTVPLETEYIVNGDR